MTRKEWIREHAEENEDDGLILLEDYDYESAIVGLADTPKGEVVVYDRDLCIAYLLAQGMDEESAEEWLSYNTERALPYLGDRAPIILRRIPEEELAVVQSGS